MHKKWKGYFTVEASFIMPIVLFVFADHSCGTVFVLQMRNFTGQFSSGNAGGKLYKGRGRLWGSYFCRGRKRFLAGRTVRDGEIEL